MERTVGAQELRELLSLSGKMRASAAATVDLRYVALFLAAASALHDRASQLAQGAADMPTDRERHAVLHAPVSLMC